LKLSSSKIRRNCEDTSPLIVGWRFRQQLSLGGPSARPPACALGCPGFGLDKYGSAR